MIDDDNLFLAGNNCEGITQKSMSVLADVAPSTIYRAILDLKIEPLAGGYRKNFRYSVHDTRKILKRYISDKFITKKKMQCRPFLTHSYLWWLNKPLVVSVHTTSILAY